MNDQAMCNFDWAWRLLDGFYAAGVRRAVLSPGARSTPLTLAALRHPGLSSEIVIDERAAGFFALGLSKAEGIPPLLIATSGSAIANWFPAVVEADQAAVPLLLLSADRPPELQDCGANQTLSQLNLFGQHVRAFHALPPAESQADWLTSLAAYALAQTQGRLPGPVHLNIPFREPLVPTETPAIPLRTGPTHWQGKPSLSQHAITDIAALMLAGQGAIVCGPTPLSDPEKMAISGLADRLQAPLFADLLSGLRSEPRTRQVLSYPDRVAERAPAPDWILHFGGAPLTRAQQDWLKRCDSTTHLILTATGRLPDPARLATHVLHTDLVDFCERLALPAPSASQASWSAHFQALDTHAEHASAQVCSRPERFAGTLFRQLFAALPRSTPVFLGNSLTVRQANLFAGCPAHPLKLFGNRGLAGIDGNLSTTAGIAVSQGKTLALVGDLTFLHDLNALSLCQKQGVTLLLLDNGGGGIFDHLPQAKLPEFETGWLTPQTFDAEAAAHTFGLSYRAPKGVAEAVNDTLNALASPGGHLIHFVLDRPHELTCLQQVHALFHSGAPTHAPS